MKSKGWNSLSGTSKRLIEKLLARGWEPGKRSSKLILGGKRSRQNDIIRKGGVYE